MILTRSLFLPGSVCLGNLQTKIKSPKNATHSKGRWVRRALNVEDATNAIRTRQQVKPLLKTYDDKVLSLFCFQQKTHICLLLRLRPCASTYSSSTTFLNESALTLKWSVPSNNGKLSNEENKFSYNFVWIRRWLNCLKSPSKLRAASTFMSYLVLL